MKVNWSKTSHKILIGSNEFTFGDVSDLRQLLKMTSHLLAFITDAVKTSKAIQTTEMTPGHEAVTKTVHYRQGFY